MANCIRDTGLFYPVLAINLKIDDGIRDEKHLTYLCPYVDVQKLCKMAESLYVSRISTLFGGEGEGGIHGA